MSEGLVTLRTAPRMHFALEREGAFEAHLDYVLTPYVAPAHAEGKLRSINVLRASFEAAGRQAEGEALIERVRSTLGRDRTVWGVKQHPDGTLGWEFYFYDWERRHADLSIASVRAMFAPIVKVTAVEGFALPWHMISVELGAAQLEGEEAAIDVYVDMRSYTLRGRHTELANVYTFHDPKTEIDHVMQRLRSSLHFDWKHDALTQLLPPWMFRCHKLCVANKRHADALYAARIPTSALQKFLVRHEWPLALRAFVDTHAHELDHLLFDVGVDFAREDGRLVTRKTGIYGFF